MSISEQINEIIQKTLSDRKITNNKFAEMMGVSAQYIGQLFKGNRRWNAEMQNKAFEALNINASIKVLKRRSKPA